MTAGGDDHLPVAAGAQGARVRTSVLAARDAGVNVTLIDDVLAHVCGKSGFLDEVTPAPAPEFARSSRVGDVVAAPHDVGKKPLIEPRPRP